MDNIIFPPEYTLSSTRVTKCILLGIKSQQKYFQLEDSEVGFQIRFIAHCPNLWENSLDSDIGYE